MTEPQDARRTPADDSPLSTVHDATHGDPPDDRRADPPAPAAARVSDRNAAETESQRETLETVRSISRLEESN